MQNRIHRRSDRGAQCHYRAAVFHVRNCAGRVGSVDQAQRVRGPERGCVRDGLNTGRRCPDSRLADGTGWLIDASLMR